MTATSNGNGAAPAALDPNERMREFAHEWRLLIANYADRGPAEAELGVILAAFVDAIETLFTSGDVEGSRRMKDVCCWLLEEIERDGDAAATYRRLVWEGERSDGDE